MNLPSIRLLIPSSKGQRFCLLGILALVLLPLSGCSSSSTEPEAMQAVAAAKNIIEGFQARKSQVLWDCWTDLQRAEVNELVHRFAEKTPPSLWENCFEVAGLWGKALKEKREFALNCPHLQKGHADLQESGEALSAFLIHLAESDFSQLDKLKTADGGELLKQIDPYFMQAIPAIFHLFPDQPKQQVALESYEKMLNVFSTASFALGEYKDDWATVHFVSAETDVTKIPFVKADQRWVPEIPAEDWQAGMAAAHQWLDDFDSESIPQLALVGVMLDSLVKTRLQQVLDTKTQAEFDALFAEAADPVLPFFFFAGEKKFALPQ